MKSKNLNIFVTALLVMGVLALSTIYLYSPSQAIRSYSMMSFVKQTSTCGDWNNEFPCFNTTLRKGVIFPICTYEAKTDNFVSASFISGGYYEQRAVNSVIQQLVKWNDSIFIDIGANIGAYTLGVAHATKRSVICVEPNRETMIRLRKSICLGQLRGRVTLLHGAVSNVANDEVRLARSQNNRGLTMILEGTACKITHNVVNCMDETIKTFTLDDLLNLTDAKTAIFKVDVEGSEVKVFNEATASKFFEKVHVPIVYMEVVYFKKFFQDNGPKEKRVNQMTEFFYTRNYTPSTYTMKPLSRDWRSWPDNVLFVKSQDKQIDKI